MEKFKKTEEKKIKQIAEKFRDILDILELDISDNSLQKTPERVATMYVKEIFSGLSKENFPSISLFDTFPSDKHFHDMVFLKVGCTSFCEHHFVPMIGDVYVAYIPNKKLIGLSKVPRIVNYFAKRPQLQERLTTQIVECLQETLEIEDVAASSMMVHHCVRARGVSDQNGHTITNVLRGKFLSEKGFNRQFFEAINRQQ